MMIKLERLERNLKKTRLLRVKAVSEEEEAGKEKEMDDVINNDLKCEQG